MTEITPTKTHRDENFPVASLLIAPQHRATILAFYRFVRAADDIADSAVLSAPDKIQGLDRLEAGLLGNADAGAPLSTSRRGSNSFVVGVASLISAPSLFSPLVAGTRMGMRSWFPGVAPASCASRGDFRRCCSLRCCDRHR